METGKRNVLLLGRLDNDSITTAIKSIGCEYTRKDFRSSRENWESMAWMLEHGTAANISCVLAKFTEATLISSLRPGYDAAFDRICTALSSHRHIVFVYADNLSGKFSVLERFDLNNAERQAAKSNMSVQELNDWFNENYLRQLGYTRTVDEFKGDLKFTIKKLYDRDLRIAPYRTSVNLNVGAQEFIEDAFRGLLMRIYIPNDRIWAGEIDKLLNLFQDYLRKVQNYPVTLDERRTEKGLLYGFYCTDDSVKPDQLSGLLGQFSTLMEVAATNPAQAAELLRNTKVPEAQLHSLLEKYSKEARRLSLDIQHEHESKLLTIRHRFESELLDAATDHEQRDYLALLDKSDKTISTPLNIIRTTGLSNRADTVVHNHVINMTNPQFISQAGGIIAQEINGTIEYTEQDERIFELIRQYAPEAEQLDLRSSLDELKDESVPQSQRTTPWQKIQGFLSKHSDKLEKTAFTVLEKYIEHLLAKN